MYVLKVKYYDVKYEEHSKDEACNRFRQLSNMCDNNITRILEMTLINDKGEILSEYKRFK